jgi:MFS family permease
VTTVAGTGAAYRQALSNRDFRLLVLALSQSSMGDWAYNVALVVYVYDKTHSPAWVAAATIGRMVPRLLASLYAGVIAEKFERVRIMVRADLARAVIMAVMAVVAGLDGPAWLLIALAGVLAAVGSVYEPATAAMVPQLLGEEQLAAGNALTETINNVAIVVGPAVGALVLLIGAPWVVLGLDAVTFLLSALLVRRLAARSVPTDVTSAGGPVRQVMVGVNAIVHSSAATILVAFPVLTTLLYGVDSVLFVFLSRDRLGTQATGYGYLLVALGVGGIIASAFVNRLAAMPRLSAVLAFGMVAYCAPTALLVLVHAPWLAFVIEVVRGIATLLVDVLAITALQRSLAPELISRVFGVFWAVALAGLAVGALITPILLRAVGLDNALLIAGLAVPVGVLAVYPRLVAVDRVAGERAHQLAPRMVVLENLQIFAAAPRTVLERLAAAATEVTAAPGEVIIAEGSPADAFFVLHSGVVEILAAGERYATPQVIRTLEAPAYVGEIGLIEQIPRTATVRAVGDCQLWRIDGDEFLAALSESSPSRLLIQGLAGRLATTHPSRSSSLTEVAEPVSAQD